MYFGILLIIVIQLKDPALMALYFLFQWQRFYFEWLQNIQSCVWFSVYKAQHQKNVGILIYCSRFRKRIGMKAASRYTNIIDKQQLRWSEDLILHSRFAAVKLRYGKIKLNSSKTVQPLGDKIFLGWRHVIFDHVHMFETSFFSTH